MNRMATGKVASSANVQFHARIISQKHIMRELIRISADTIRDAYDEGTDVFELLDRSEQEMFAVTSGNLRRNYEPMSDLIQGAIAHIEATKNKGGGMSGVPTGFTQLDKLTGGWQPSDMIIVAARPAMGRLLYRCPHPRGIPYHLDFTSHCTTPSHVRVYVRAIAARMLIEMNHRCDCPTDAAGVMHTYALSGVLSCSDFRMD